MFWSQLGSGSFRGVQDLSNKGTNQMTTNESYHLKRLWIGCPRSFPGMGHPKQSSFGQPFPISQASDSRTFQYALAWAGDLLPLCLPSAFHHFPQQIVWKTAVAFPNKDPIYSWNFPIAGISNSCFLHSSNVCAWQKRYLSDLCAQTSIQ